MATPELLPNAFVRLDARSGWRALGDAAPAGLVFDGTGVALGEPGRRPIPDTEMGGSFGGRTLPRGVAVAADGRVFLADPEHRRVLVLLPGWGEDARPVDAAPYWPFRPLYERPAPPAADACSIATPNGPDDPYALVRPTDVALAPNGDLVIVDAGADRILVLVLPQAAIRRVVRLAGAPTAIGFDTRGRAYVALAGAGRVARFAPDWTPDPDYRGGAGTLVAPTAIAVVAGAACRCRAGDRCACTAPADAGPPDGTSFVVDGSAIRALDPDGRPVERALPDRLPRPPFAVSADGALTRPLPPRAPLRLPGVVVDRRGRLAGLPLLARPRRIVRPRTATWIAGPFDGGRDGFAWDRVLLDVDLPDRTRLLVSTLTDDAALEAERIAHVPAEAWATPLAIEPGATAEVLIQSGAGRFLWLSVELFGDGEATPAIHAVEIGAPRASSIRYLPAPFHQDPESRAFLDRLLAYFDAVFAAPALAGRHFAAHLDPRSVPAGPFLDWLGAWFDWRFMADWPEATRRDMIAQAIPFFRERGTPRGLRRIVQWHTGVADPYPIVVEHFRLRGRPPDPPLSIAGTPLVPARGQHAHAFTLVLPAAAAGDRTRLKRLVEAQKPAHTRCDLRLIEPGIRIARQSSIGVDTLLGGPDMQPLDAGRLAQTLFTAPAGPPTLGSAVLAPPGG